MPSAAQSRRLIQTQVESSSSEEEPRRQSTQNRGRQAPASDDESGEDAEEEGDGQLDAEVDVDGQDQVVKKLVRYALACEYQRISIKRVGITEKVIGKQRGAFKRVFEAAQKQLRIKFGMEMVELPVREKVTMKEKRAAAKQKTKSSSIPTSYVLTTILPVDYRTSDIIPPSMIGSPEEEATYVGLCTMIVTLIALSPGGIVPDHKLGNLLQQLNLNENTPLDKKDATLALMIKQGYIVKNVDRSADEETVDWRVGPRGKVEVGNKGIQGFVQEIYGDNAPDDLEKRLQRSLGMDVKKVLIANPEHGEEDEEVLEAPRKGDPGPSIARRRRN